MFSEYFHLTRERGEEREEGKQADESVETLETVAREENNHRNLSNLIFHARESYYSSDSTRLSEPTVIRHFNYYIPRRLTISSKVLLARTGERSGNS